MEKSFEKKINKKYFLVVLFIFSLYLCDAQMLSGRRGKLETIKMSYITKKLNLSDKEARNFWVIYPQYLKDLSAVRRNNSNDEIQLEEQVLAVRKKYRDEMLPILKDPQRVNSVFTLEKNYREMLRDELRKRMYADSSKDSLN